LAVAGVQARLAGCRVRCRLVRSRPPGRAIVDEAIERRSDLIYVSTEHAPSEERLLGPTTRYVLAHRPCRVVIEHDPTGAAEVHGPPVAAELDGGREPVRATVSAATG